MVVLWWAWDCGVAVVVMVVLWWAWDCGVAVVVMVVSLRG
jgi:hypothetical protein